MLVENDRGTGTQVPTSIVAVANCTAWASKATELRGKQSATSECYAAWTSGTDGSLAGTLGR